MFNRKEEKKQMRYYAVRLKDQKDPEYVKADNMRRGYSGAATEKDYFFLNGAQMVAVFPGALVLGVTSTRFQSD